MIDLHGISQAGFDLIVNEEVTGQSAYEAKYRRPTWPGGNSGPTIGIGYDLGMADAATIREDWTGKVPDAMVAAMCSVAGIHGEAARQATARIRPLVDIPWAAAVDVFSNRNLPKYDGMCRKVLPNYDLLSPDCRGVLTSLAFNRGASFNTAGDRYEEMRAIRAHMVAKEFAKIPAEIRAMKRLWVGQNLPGLLSRRDHEAALFERGLTAAPAATSTAPQQPSADRVACIKRLQQQLADANLYDGAVDGLIGPKTINAVQGFCELPVTGIADAATQAKIDMALAALAADVG